MKNILAAVILACGLALAAGADVTIKQTTTGKGLGMSGSTPSTTYIKGNKMRTDSVFRGTTQSMIFDLDAQKLYMFDSKKKQADEWDMAAFAAELGQSVDASSMTASFKPSGESREIAGKKASGYDMLVSMKSAMGGSPDMMMTITMQGPVWIVKNAPGAAEYANFYKAAVEKGWIFSDPRGAKAQPGQAKAMAEMHKAIAAAGGIAYQTEMNMKMSGEGPMAAVMSRMGNISMTTVTDSVETGSLSDDLFTVPPGYKVSSKK
jgi:hypothetical protein